MTDRTKELVDEFSRILDGKSDTVKILMLIDELNTIATNSNTLIGRLIDVMKQQNKRITELEREVMNLKSTVAYVVGK